MNINLNPQIISKLTRLRILDLDKCAMTSLPRFLAQLSTLEILDVPNNFVKDIPIEFKTAKSLRELDLSNNLIYTLPSQFRTHTRCIINIGIDPTYTKHANDDFDPNATRCFEECITKSCSSGRIQATFLFIVCLILIGMVYAFYRVLTKPQLTRHSFLDAKLEL
jgi:hypothetical protein